MKVGLRKRSIKKTIRAKTTGRVKRKVKSTINPLYGKKNINLIKNPTKYVKDKTYHAVTAGIPKTGLANDGKPTKFIKSKDPNDWRTGHSIILHILLLYVIVGFFTIPYYSISKNHYWHW